MVPFEVNYSKPDYAAIFAHRHAFLQKIKDDQESLGKLKLYYRDHPWEFISDWGMTHDPRQTSVQGGIADMPFILWPRQVELVQWMHERYLQKERGWVEKSRDFGVSWLAVGYAVSMWCFHDGYSAGFGSRKEQLVDRLGDIDSIFEKIRFFVNRLPRVFWPEGFSYGVHATYMRLISPVSGSSITGEAGDNIGRGGRKSVYFVDEKAFVERQERVDAALSANTDCQIDISTFNGTGNLYYRQIEEFKNTRRHFVCDWRDDPRKDDAWYQKKCEELPEEIVAQEIDRDPEASNTDSFIPAKYVRAALDAHKVLGFEPSGLRATAFDPADTGDAKAVVGRHGSVVTLCKQKTSGDITDAIPWAYAQADEHRSDLFIYDGDGMGTAAIKVDSVRRTANRFEVVAYHGSGEVEDKDLPYTDGEKKTNGDHYHNFRSQSWSWVAERFRNTYHAVNSAKKGNLIRFSEDQLVSIDTEKCEDWKELVSELSSPKRLYTDNGKILVESKKKMRQRQVKSPNLADSFIMSFSKTPTPQHLPESFEPEFG